MEPNPRSQKLRGKPKQNTKQFLSLRLGMESQQRNGVVVLLRRVGWFGLLMNCGGYGAGHRPMLRTRKTSQHQTNFTFISLLFAFILSSLPFFEKEERACVAAPLPRLIHSIVSFQSTIPFLKSLSFRFI